MILNDTTHFAKNSGAFGENGVAVIKDGLFPKLNSLGFPNYLYPMGEYSMGDALRMMLNKSNLRNGVRKVQIEEVWETVMGKTIAKYTERLKIINKTLFITTYMGPLKNELMYQKPQIIQRINEAFGETVISEVIVE